MCVSLSACTPRTRRNCVHACMSNHLSKNARALVPEVRYASRRTLRPIAHLFRFPAASAGRTAGVSTRAHALAHKLLQCARLEAEQRRRAADRSGGRRAYHPRNYDTRSRRDTCMISLRPGPAADADDARRRRRRRRRAQRGTTLQLDAPHYTLSVEPRRGAR